ncbi:MAG: hypothetical protein CMC23_05450 [Flavobacteriaceae bacterium]|nr:hypothetical protein [Flavobacteriaceae bacterium]
MINLPPFLIRDMNLDKINLLKKIKLIIFGKFLSLIINKINGNYFCLILNIFFNRDGKIYFEQDKYYKLLKNNEKIYFPNKRILRIVKSVKFQYDLIIDSYMLDEIALIDNDTVIDCGANIGELKLALNSRGLKINYYGFEPEEPTYKCLSLNVGDTDKLYKNALGNKNETKTLYLDSIGGNSSLVDFGANKKEIIEVISLDSLNLDIPIKVFKVEAEGYEPEVLEGAIDTLKLVEYVTVDFGAERGKNNSNTVVEVNQILLNNNFKLIKFSNFRTVGLYKNKNL